VALQSKSAQSPISQRQRKLLGTCSPSHSINSDLQPFLSTAVRDRINAHGASRFLVREIYLC
jgi:hypothetical protein